MIAVPRVVLVGHDASATGVPRCVLAWARWARASRSAEVTIHLERGGPLLDPMAAVATTHVRSRLVAGAAVAADAVLPTRPAAWLRAAATPLPPSGADLTVVAASIAAWRAAAARARRAPLVLWLHELDGVADRLVSPDERARLLRSTVRIVAVGDRVAAMAVDRWGVDPATVSVVESFVDPLPAGPTPPATATGATGAAAPSTDVLAVGSLVPRKGAEHVAAAAALLAHDRPGLQAAWVGGPVDGPYDDLVRADGAGSGAPGALALAGAVDDVGPWLDGTGVLLHLAREDPAPLVVLEAGLRGVPVVTWDTGGAADLLRRAGLPHLVVAPGDVVAAAEAVGTLLDDPAARSRAGAALQQAASARTTDRLAPALLAAIRGVAP